MAIKRDAFANQTRISSEFAGDLLSLRDAEALLEQSWNSVKIPGRCGQRIFPPRLRLIARGVANLKDGTREDENFINLKIGPQSGR
jgi:hypothetical protein